MKQIRCQVCGDVIPGAHHPKSTCDDCQQCAAQPTVGAHVAREFTCADCGVRFILATGEQVAHRDTRYCVTCWRAQRYTTRIVGVKDGLPIARQEAVRTSVPLWAIQIGVDWPCTLEDVKRRGRELFKKHHPDFGGDHAKFIITHEYYEQGLAYFAERQAEVLA